MQRIGDAGAERARLPIETHFAGSKSVCVYLQQGGSLPIDVMLVSVVSHTDYLVTAH